MRHNRNEGKGYHLQQIDGNNDNRSIAIAIIKISSSRPIFIE